METYALTTIRSKSGAADVKSSEKEDYPILPIGRTVQVPKIRRKRESHNDIVIKYDNCSASVVLSPPKPIIKCRKIEIVSSPNTLEKNLPIIDNSV